MILKIESKKKKKKSNGIKRQNREDTCHNVFFGRRRTRYGRLNGGSFML